MPRLSVRHSPHEHIPRATMNEPLASILIETISLGTANTTPVTPGTSRFYGAPTATQSKTGLAESVTNNESSSS